MSEPVAPRIKMLQEAGDLIVGGRDQVYGTPQENFERIAKLWATILGVEIRPYEVTLCMAALKMARLVNSPVHEDSWVDAAGYIALGYELSDGEVSRKSREQ